MNRSRKSFLDDLLEDSPSIGSPVAKPRPSTAVPQSVGPSKGKSVRFSESGHRDQEVSSFGQSSRSSSGSGTFDQLFSNDGHGVDDDDILGSMSFTRGSRSSNVSNVPSAGKSDGGEIVDRNEK